MKTNLLERISALHRAYPHIQVIIYEIYVSGYTAIGCDAELCAKANKELVRNTSGRVYMHQCSMGKTVELLRRQGHSIAIATRL